MTWRPLLPLAVLALLAGCAGEPAAPEKPRAASAQAADITAAVIAQSQLYRPEGNGPFPAVIVLHGCGGITPHPHGWARRLAAWGYVALVLDSFGPRGHGAVCALVPQPTTPEMRAGDTWAAARHLGALPFVRADRIGVLGFSHGGRTLLHAVQQRRADNPPPLAAAVAFYPGCDERVHDEVGVPTLILIGDKDDWTPAERCRRLAAALRRPDLVGMTIYPNAHHGFDFERPELRKVRGGQGDHQVGRDPQAAPDALVKTRAFFDRHLKG